MITGIIIDGAGGCRAGQSLPWTAIPEAAKCWLDEMEILPKELSGFFPLETLNHEASPPTPRCMARARPWGRGGRPGAQAKLPFYFYR
jgi:hypothetical protein